MNKHTPGPWVIKDEGNVMSGRRLVANCMGYASHIEGTIEENKANARLIAKAPEMLGALQDEVIQLANLASMVDPDETEMLMTTIYAILAEVADE